MEKSIFGQVDRDLFEVKEIIESRSKLLLKMRE